MCVYTFKCSCSDNLIYFNICKHIHACAKVPSASHEHNENLKMQDTNQILLLESETDNNSIVISFKKQIQEKLDLIAGLNQKVNLDKSNFLNVSKKLDSIISHLNNIPNYKSDSPGISGGNVNIRKNVEKQKRFLSTKTRKRGHHSNPSKAENRVIQLRLLEENDSIVNVHSDFDHTYVK